EHLRFGFERYQQRRDTWNAPFGYSFPVVWRPGLRFFSVLVSMSWSRTWSTVFVALALAICSARMIRRRRMDEQQVVFLTLALLETIMLVSSSALLGFRGKEQRSMLPVTSALTAISIGVAAPAVFRIARQLAGPAATGQNLAEEQKPAVPAAK